ncbi:hypothetical protein ASG47_09090 [Devosia sp. Leaf420]|uniref:hypothetical protein n=1 Tax=Devosia sp. Leaf420 TaxID=1736374 RepID=UPI0007141A12|nr:hypothetical protein [Devosia sp. Leaf420]KQT48490.1 hypothetical protein ASG47_09090 [Devosia sp. Leaf420]
MHRLLVALIFLAFSSAAFGQEIGDHTHMSYDPAHGTQVEYLAANGNSYLWYPGNRSILPGRWKREGDQMWFAYGANTYNPATGQSGGGFECVPFRIYWGSVERRMPGDILGLSSRTDVPFRLEKRRTTLEKLLARVSPGAVAPPLEVGTRIGNQEIVLSCANILANAENGKAGAQLAISTYFHGVFMGKPCVDVDYDKAYALAQKAGISFEPWARVLRERAAAGHPRAVAAVARLGL